MIYVFRAITKSLGKEKYLKAILRYPFIVYLQVSKSVVNLQLAIEFCNKNYSSNPKNCISITFLDGVMVLENRNCTQCHLRIKRDDCFYIYKSNRNCQLCQSCFIKSGQPEDNFKLGAYEPGM